MFPDVNKSASECEERHTGVWGVANGMRMRVYRRGSAHQVNHGGFCLFSDIQRSVCLLQG